MKTLNEYVADINKVYSYRVKIAGDLDTDKLAQFIENLGKFDVVKHSEPNTTPISTDPVGFPQLKNEALNTFTIDFNYPAIPDQITQEARLAGINPANIIVVDAEWDDSMADDRDTVEDIVRLETPEYPKASKSSTDASKKYSESFQDIVKNAADLDYKIAGKKTPPAKYNTDGKEGVDSPFTKTSKIPPMEDILDGK